MKALLDPQSSISRITKWTDTEPYTPFIETYENSVRVAEVAEMDFPVSLPLFWVDCNDDVIADEYYFDNAQKKFFKIENVEMPKPIQPVTDLPSV